MDHLKSYFGLELINLEPFPIVFVFIFNEYFQWFVSCSFSHQSFEWEQSVKIDLNGFFDFKSKFEEKNNNIQSLSKTGIFNVLRKI